MAAVQAAWTSRFGFLMAAIGFAVGLGNIWRFPYVAGENGGSAFVLVYLLFVFLIGIPILIAEISLGRQGRASPPLTFAALAGAGTPWRHVGHLNLLTAFTIMIVYTVVAGWVLYYFYLAVTSGFGGYDGAVAQNRFDQLLASAQTSGFWSLLPVLAAAAIVYAGVEKGIERAVSLLMPMLFLLMLGLAVYNGFTGGMGAALDYLLTPDFSKITPQVMLAAVGQAFFSMGVAMAGMMVFGAYLPERVNVASSAVIIGVADTVVALVAGLVIFPMVFLHGLDPAGGSGLIFVTLPVAFAGISSWVAITFFLLLSVAAVTSLVGLYEPVVAWLIDRFAMSRRRAVVLLGAATALGGIISTLTYNHWATVAWFGRSLADWMDFIPNQLFLPLGGLLIAVFAAWKLSLGDATPQAVGLSAGLLTAWQRLLRFLVVPAVLVILVTGLIP